MRPTQPQNTSDLSRRALLRLGGMLFLLSACSPGVSTPAESSPGFVETPSLSDSPIMGIAAGRYHSMALFRDGQIYSWGGNRSGQLGDGTLRTKARPVKTLMQAAQAIATHDRFSMALRDDGTVWTWGHNEGQLGYKSDLAAVSSPQQVPELQDVVGIAAGAYHGLAWTKSGSLWAWGVAWGAQELSDLGTDPSLIDEYREILGEDQYRPGILGLSIPHPYPLLDLTNVVLVKAGPDHTLALDEDGNLWAWGRNSSGELGDGTRIDRLKPIKIDAPSDIISLAAGGGFNVALRQDGTLLFWGNPLGTPRRRTIGSPSPIEGLDNIVAVAAGSGHILALRSDGTVWAWGWNLLGQLGDGTNEDQLAPIQVTSLPDIIALAAGYSHNLALDSDGQLWAWGSNEFRQLGDGTNQNRATPVKVLGLT